MEREKIRIGRKMREILANAGNREEVAIAFARFARESEDAKE